MEEIENLVSFINKLLFLFNKRLKLQCDSSVYYFQFILD